jgi:CMP-N,N'-diacetyllegionaminic acid synthase
LVEDKSVLVVVPARGGSKGIKLKNLRKIGGISLVARVGMVVQELDMVDYAVVSTDHSEIAKVAKESGLEVPFFRPENLSGDRIGDVGVLTHALVECEKLNNQKYDIIVMLQPTSPLRTSEHVKNAIKALIVNKADAVWSVSETDSKGHPLKQLVFENNEIDYYDPKGANIIARQQLVPTYHKNGIVYVMTRECLLDKKSIKGDRCIPLIIEEYVSNIDTELDIAFAEFLLTYKGK